MKKKKRKAEAKEVPCNGCMLCCQGDVIRLKEDEKSAGYKTEPHPNIPGALMLAHKPNGDCVYLTEIGCSIYDSAPSICQIADCRNIALKFDFETAMKLHALKKIDIRVWDKGRKLLEEMNLQKKKNS